MYIHFSRITSPRKLSITRPLKPWMTSADLALEFKSQLDALESHISQFLPFARGALMTLAQQNGGPLTSTSESSNACNFVPPAYNISPKQHDVIKGLVLTVPAADILNDDWLGKSTSATTPSPRLKSEDYPSPCSKIDDVLDGDKMFEQAENGKEPVWKKIARSSLSGRESTGVFRMRRGSKPKSNWASKLQQGILNQDEAVSQWAAILDRTDSETIARNKQTSISNINFLGHNEERKVQTTITEDSNERPATTSASDVVLDLMGVSSFDLALEDGEIPNTVADLVVQSETLSRNRFERAFQSETIPRKRAERNRVSSTPSTMLSKRGATSISVDRPKTEERNITNQMESAVSNKEKRTLQRGKAAFYSLDRENQLDGVYQISGINISLLVGCTKVLLSVIMISQLYLIPFALGFDMILPEYYSVLVSVANFADCILELTVLNVDHVAMRSLKKPTLQDWRDFYVRHGFLIDIVTIIPFELLPIPNEQYLWVIRLMRLTKLPHLIHTAYKSFKTDKDPQTMSVMRQSNALIVPLFACFCIFLHLQACILFFAGRLRGFSNADISPLEDSPLINKYIWAVSIAIGNTFPMIYKPTDPSEQFLTFSFVILGAAFNASIVGVLSALAMGYDASGRLYKQKIDELQDYMRHKNLAPVTRRKILKYYDFKYRGKYFEESALLQDLNESLRMEIATHNCRELVRKVPFLFRLQNDGRDELFVSKIASALQACHYIAGDVVFVQGQMGDDMFFILRGSLHVIVGGKPVATLTEGSFFGGKH
ncbi:hypothetical protein BC830DRAFT_20182 [Chytriomyces sp. MP71]|nr:hypothetical protein BC830DRAFT_20182 [Chytriomyces sp. MP71]